MSERIGHGRSYTAVLGGEFVERGNGVGVAQDNGDLPTLAAQGGLPLCAGLGLHWSGRNQVSDRVDGAWLDRHFAANSELNNKHAVATKLGNHKPAKLIARLQNFAELHNIADFHFVLRVGPIPTMWLSSHVTSDTSTPYGNIFLNGGQA